VRREGDHLVAHAWIVCRGTVIGETDHNQYVPFGSAVLAT
jgi:hypothetical protein